MKMLFCDRANSQKQFSFLEVTDSKTDFVGRFSLEIIVNEILVIINNVAIIAVVFVKKLPADLEDIKLS